MTEQTKRFIEIADIVALRIDCGSCGSMVATPLVSFQNAPHGCSNCGTPFVGYESTNALQGSFDDIVVALKKTQRIADHHRFKVTLEIAVPKTLVSQQSEQEKSK